MALDKNQKLRERIRGVEYAVTDESESRGIIRSRGGDCNTVRRWDKEDTQKAIRRIVQNTLDAVPLDHSGALPVEFYCQRTAGQSFRVSGMMGEGFLTMMIAMIRAMKQGPRNRWGRRRRRAFALSLCQLTVLVHGRHREPEATEEALYMRLLDLLGEYRDLETPSKPAGVRVDLALNGMHTDDMKHARNIGFRLFDSVLGNMQLEGQAWPDGSSDVGARELLPVFAELKQLETGVERRLPAEFRSFHQEEFEHLFM
ncbi:hypothetical protein C8J56DRAFT_896123 [Mycena floridula]|nr:hypothetical protein C8J56DRAFT_896123 [Mycena floridula]